MRFSAPLFLALFSGFFASFAHGNDTPPLPVGLAGPMTGTYASLGDMMKRGMEIAVEDINANGGVLGRQLTPIVMDDRCDPREAVSVAGKLINYEVPVVIGHFCSGSSIPASDMYASSGIIQISPASTNPKMTQRDIPTIFRVCGRDDAQGKVSAAWVHEQYSGQNVAIVHDKQTYSKGLADSFKEELQKISPQNKIVLEETVTPGEKDYSAFITKLKQSGATVLYYGGYHSELGLIVRQMQAQGLKLAILSGDALGTNEFWQITGAAGEGVMFTQGADPQHTPDAQHLVTRLKEKKYPLEVYSFYTYAAMQSWAQAVEAAGVLDGMKVAQKLKENTFRTVLGPISYNAQGDINASTYAVYSWKDGKFSQLPQ